MKTLLIASLALFCTMVYFRTVRFDFLDFTNNKLNISWDDITEDLWP